MDDPFSTIEIDGFPGADMDSITVRLGENGEEELRVAGICTGDPADQLLWALENVLRGNDSVMVSYTEYPPAGEGGTLHSVVENGVRYLGKHPEHVSATDSYEDYLSSTATVGRAEMEDSYPVDTLALSKAVLEVGELQLQSHREIRQKYEIHYRKFDRLYRDTVDMVEYYRQHGSLDGFELSRSRKELERFLYEREWLPRTEEFVKEHGLVGDLILELLSSGLSDKTVENRLRNAVKGQNWVTMAVLRTLKEHPDDRAEAAYMPIHYERCPKLQHEAALMLWNLTHLKSARSHLEAGLNSVDDLRTRAVIERALDDAPNDFRVS